MFLRVPNFTFWGGSNPSLCKGLNVFFLSFYASFFPLFPCPQTSAFAPAEITCGSVFFCEYPLWLVSKANLKETNSLWVRTLFDSFPANAPCETFTEITHPFRGGFKVEPRDSSFLSFFWGITPPMGTHTHYPCKQRAIRFAPQGDVWPGLPYPKCLQGLRVSHSRNIQETAEGCRAI